MIRRVSLVVLLAFCLSLLPWGPASAVAPSVPVYNRGATREKVVALTFDDGYHNETCIKVRKILKQYEVPATIFPVASWAANNKQIVQGFIADGHEIGNHTASHMKLTMLPPQLQKHEIAHADSILRKMSGEAMTNFFRPPYGAYNNDTLKAAAELGLTTLTWSVDSWDWRDIPVSQVVDRVVKGVHPGAIVLMHLSARNSVQALPAIIEGLRQQGYRFVTVSELLGTKSGAERVAPKEVRVAHQGQLLELIPSARLINGSTYVPARALLTQMQMQVRWNGSTQTVTCTNLDIELKFTVSEQLATVNNEVREIALSPLLVDGSVFLPLRPLADLLGWQLTWQAEKNLVTIR